MSAAGAHPRIIACVYLPRLALSCLDDSEAENTVVVVRPERPDWVVRGIMRIADCSDDLRAMRVSPPMRIVDAQLHAPALDVQVVSEAQLAHRLVALAELCAAHAPLVEVGEGTQDALYLDFTGVPEQTETLLARVHATLSEVGERCFVGASSGKRLARALARAAHHYPQKDARRQSASGARGGQQSAPPPRLPILFVPEQKRGEALKRLPLGLTDISPDLLEALRRLGLKTVQDLMRLKSADLAPRLFKEGKKILDLLSMSDAEPVNGMTFASVVREERDFDFGIIKLESLLFVLQPMCQRLCRRVMARGEELLSVELELFIERAYGAGRRRDTPEPPVVMGLTFPEPLRQPRALLEAISLRLAREGSPGEVHKLRLHGARTTQMVARQPGLFADLTAAPSHIPDELAGYMAELVSEFGGDKVGVLTPQAHMTPERMTALSWPPPAAAYPPGHFLRHWPWPTQILPAPQPLDASAVKTPHAFATLATARGAVEAHDDARHYARIELTDGREVFGFWDPELEHYFLQGFYD